ncbi:SpoIVB peptidase [Anaerocolumna aminovalerica]|uniref:Stage IV sporulation protein B n=1 Tax=Anaerocolumna aminovalerica TaxID=1527 RepID=A0A1I5EY51_9FIRM|nr:SpoIVB peptidase [Anaerocolumna aminovalerica]MBU5332053.1 SpoIVB peptidase [Anaerocolumna aminovalerica]SFO16363.1 stage IV sporulation protein B [Anaerocolumna aminovalerica]
MKKKSIYRKILLLLFVINVFVILIFAYKRLYRSIPDKIRIKVGEDEQFNFNLPFQADFTNENIGVISVNNKKVPANQIKIDLNKPFTIKSTELGQYKISLKLFGFLEFKKIEIGVVEDKELRPSGAPIGIYVETDGVMVLGTGAINASDGLNYEPSLNKLKSGDYITAINHVPINSKEELIELIQKCDGRDLLVDVRRNEEIIQYKITPVKTADGEYKIGTWIRDNTQGIGTMTFTTKEGKFGALGHGITDVDTSLIMEIQQGYLYNAEIMTIIKGRQGAPGELIGVINQNEFNKIGKIKKNTNQGIFGSITENYVNAAQHDFIPIGLKQEVTLGPATILSCVEDEVKEYDIEIKKIDLNNTNSNKGMVINIVDEELLSLTGGIVQGMSGSPIIQNGKIIGAVTHVFIQDSTKGYGTFIENMIYNLDGME